MSEHDCPCGSGKSFSQCCQPILSGREKAPTAEALMRARYSAHVENNFAFVAATHAPEAQDSYNVSAAEAQAKTMEWAGLEITEVDHGGEDDAEGWVTFAVRYMHDGQLHKHRERAQFRREAGEWVYVDGKINPNVEPRRVEKVGRNDPCPCGSGKKYKKCCGA